MSESLAESVQPSRTRLPLWQKLGLLVLLFAWTLLFGELFLRALSPQPLVPRYVTGGEDGIRANMPGAAFRQWTPEVDVTIHYNAAGMRDDRPPPPLAKAPGECRIALLGDSYFAGFESDWNDTYANRLEQALHSRGADCRVLDFAVSGFGHAEMLVALNSRVKQWQPDLVVVSIHQTDGIDNLRSNLFRLTDDGRLEPTGATYLPGVAISDRLNGFWLYRWAQENSHLYSAAREWAGHTGKKLLAQLRQRPMAEGEEAPADDAEDNGGKAWVGSERLNRALVKDLLTESREMGASMLFVDIPTMGNRTRYTSIAGDLIGPEFLAEIPFVSPIDRFRHIMNPQTKIYLERGHRHWTPLGNREAAEVSADAIIARGLVARD